MRILVTGAQGMLGRTLVRRLPEAGHGVLPTARSDLDLTRASAVHERMQLLRPEVVVHAAAMTAVDRAETEPGSAWAGNAVASAHVAAAAHRVGARLIAFSSDYVFAGDLHRPHHEWDVTAPQTVYGRSKLAAERAIAVHCPDHTIVRTAWLYGPAGPSFVHTMLRLASAGGPAVRVVDDQRGNPTSTDAVADLVIRLIHDPIPGIVHGVCGGGATWYEFARSIFARCRSAREIVPCTTAEFPRPAMRPVDSRLDPLALRLCGAPVLPTWESALDTFLIGHPHG